MSIELLTPYWSSYIEPNLQSREISDPLGFRSAASQIARSLVPDLTQRTDSTRGFTLLLCGLDQATKGSGTSPTERFLRFERLIVLARVKTSRNTCALSGKEAAQRTLDAGAPFTLTQSILTRQLASGIWGKFRVASERLKLIESRGGTNPARSVLTQEGKNWVSSLKLDSQLKRDITNTINDGVTNEELLIRLGKCVFGKDDTPSNDENNCLTLAIEAAQGKNGALAHLRKEFDRLNKSDLTLSNLSPQKLTTHQQ